VAESAAALFTSRPPGYGFYYQLKNYVTGSTLRRICVKSNPAALCVVRTRNGTFRAWWVGLRQRRPWNRGQRLFEGIAVYWRMVDLLWIAIFTLAYLVCAS